MKLHFNLKEFNINTEERTITHNGNILSIATLESILSVIVLSYLYSPHLVKSKNGKPKYPHRQLEGVFIAAKKFKKISTKDYKKYLRVLFDHGIININKKYIPGEKSITYYLTDFFKNWCSLINITYKDEFLKRVITRKSIIKPYILRRIEEDYHKAVMVSWAIEREYKVDGFINLRKYLLNKICCHAIASKQGYFKIQYPNNRISSNFVVLGEAVRLNNISFGGDKLCSIDIPSSFPLFFSIWLIKQGFSKDDPELIDFVRGLNVSRFYNNLCSKLNKITTKKPKKDFFGFDIAVYKRNDAKKLFQIWLNGENLNEDGSAINNDINNAMNYYFPNIVRVFLTAKKKRNTIYYIQEKAEADFIFNTICRKLYEEIPGIKILTCHDSIYFEERYNVMVKNIWKEELGKLYDILGLKPDEQVKLSAVPPLIENTIIKSDQDFFKEHPDINTNIDNEIIEPISTKLFDDDPDDILPNEDLISWLSFDDKCKSHNKSKGIDYDPLINDL